MEVTPDSFPQQVRASFFAFSPCTLMGHIKHIEVEPRSLMLGGYDINPSPPQNKVEGMLQNRERAVQDSVGLVTPGFPIGFFQVLAWTEHPFLSLRAAGCGSWSFAW